MVGHYSLEVRGRAIDLVLSGSSVAEAGGVLGVHPRSVLRWAILAGMRFTRGRDGGLVTGSGVSGGVPGSNGRRLVLADRAVIQAGLAQGLSLRKIAALIGVSVSTVSREVRRAALSYRSGARVQYHAGAAEQRARTMRARPKPRKLDEDSELRRAVIAGLNGGHSPEQVAGRLPVLFPGREDMRVSHETIYQALYVQGKGALRHELAVVKALRSGRTGRKPQSLLPKRSSRPWLEGALLADRPVVVEDRAVPGHWEGDLVVGPENSGIITLVERSSRFALLGRLPGVRDSDTVIDRLTALIEGLPRQLLDSLTWDQGSEMAQHARFTIATGCPVFFCDPHSPWQRGTNENTNGLVRDFYPKGTNFNHITDEELTRTQHLLNTRPRKTLSWHTPAERLDQFIQGIALTA